jgi:hypothetical protein
VAEVTANAIREAQAADPAKEFTPLERLVIQALGGPREALKCADLPDFPSSYKGRDELRELARYVAGEAAE